MEVNRINGSQGIRGGQASQTVDTVSKSIRNEITGIQKKMKEVAADEKISVEEKTKKRQELQQEISSLNTKLRQHEEKMRKEQQAKAAAENTGEERRRKTEEESNDSGREAAEWEPVNKNQATSFVSADSTMEHAVRQGSVVSRIEGGIGVLKAEIRQDAARGEDVERKKQELKGLEQRAQRAAEAQFSMLGASHQTMKKAVETEVGKKADDRPAGKIATVDAKDIAGFVKEKGKSEQQRHFSVDI